MWRGYLDEKDGTALREWFDAGGVPVRHLHTSGHASPADLLALAQAIQPKRLIPVHGTAWDEAGADFLNLHRLADGDPLLL